MPRRSQTQHPLVVAFVQEQPDLTAMGLDAETQRKQIAAYAAVSDVLIDRWVETTGIGEEPGAGPQRLLEIAEEHPVAQLLVSRWLPLRQDNIAVVELEAAINRAGGQIVDVADSVMDNTRQGERMRDIMMAFDRYERALRTARTSAGRAAAAGAGAFTGGGIPYGYRLDETKGAGKGKLMIDEREATVVRRIFDMAYEGRKQTEIARLLNDDGITSGKGKPFSQQLVSLVLKREAFYRALEPLKQQPGMSGEEQIWHEPILHDPPPPGWTISRRHA